MINHRPEFSPVHFVDLSIQNLAIQDDVASLWAQIIQRSSFILDDTVSEFEAAFARFSKVESCVGVANGTDALEIALRALGVESGTEVIVPAMTFAATAIAVIRCGAQPVFVDVEPSTLLMDPAAAESAVGPNTSGIVPVHLYGQMARVEDFREIAGRHSVSMVEDAAQAQGATRLASGPATFGRIAATSFYPGKNLGAWGDAGAILTNDPALSSAARDIRNYGGQQKYRHDRFGFNSRLDSLQAAVLLAKLDRVEAWNSQRREAAGVYEHLITASPEICERVELPRALPENVHVWHLYVIQVDNRDLVMKRMARLGISVGVHYPDPVHLLPPFADSRWPEGSFPVAEAAAQRILSLPMFPGITEEQQDRVVSALEQSLS